MSLIVGLPNSTVLKCLSVRQAKVIFDCISLLCRQNQSASSEESVCRLYEVGRTRRFDDEDEQVPVVLLILKMCVVSSTVKIWNVLAQ